MYFIYKEIYLDTIEKKYQTIIVMNNYPEILKPYVFLNTSKTLFQIADEIWFLSGDKSTDYNYYTKRFLLMKIYALTFSFFIFDRSDNFQNTKKFLEKQIELVLGFGKLKQKLKKKN